MSPDAPRSDYYECDRCLIAFREDVRYSDGRGVPPVCPNCGRPWSRKPHGGTSPLS